MLDVSSIHLKAVEKLFETKDFQDSLRRSKFVQQDPDIIIPQLKDTFFFFFKYREWGKKSEKDLLARLDLIIQ